MLNYIIQVGQEQDFWADFWKNIWPLIKDSPMAIIAYAATYSMGYGIAFLLFRDRTELIRKWKGLYHVFGFGYTALIFLIINFQKIIDETSPITIEEISKNAPQAIIISFAVLFIIMITSIIMRDLKK